jgi:hypothetical protein
MDSMMEVKKEAIKRFGDNELSKYLIKLVQESFTNILRIKKGETYIHIKDIWSLWIKNKYIHKEFISEMIGLLMGYHNFDNKKSALMDNIVKNIDKTDISRQLKTEGYYILNNTFDNVKCLHIKERLRGLYFHPFDSSKKIIGQKFLDKQIMVDGHSTFWICDQKQILSIPEVADLTKDPALLKIVQTYLGCKPILCQTNVWYSCAGHRAERTQQFHQDYDGIHFLKVFIYLSDVTANTGPHRYIAGSIHNIIAPSGYQPSTRLSNEFVKKVYGDKIKTFTGKMGTMIIENTNGFHAGTPVQKGNRLILQLLYSATALPLQQGCQFAIDFDNINL